MAKVDFRREYQAAWAAAEEQRLRATFGDAIAIEPHIVGTEFSKSDRAMTVFDPAGEGLAVAVCFTERSAEGSFWRVDVLPIETASDDVPKTRSLQQVALEMRYGKCVYATWDTAVGATSGAGGVPDLMEGISKAIAGGVRVQRRLSIASSSPSNPYAKIASLA